MRHIRLNTLVLLLGLLAANALMLFPYRALMAGVEVNAFRVLWVVIAALFVVDRLYSQKGHRLGVPEVCLLLCWLILGCSVMRSTHMYKSLGDFLSFGLFSTYTLMLIGALAREINRRGQGCIGSYVGAFCLLALGSLWLVFFLNGGYFAHYHGQYHVVNSTNVSKAAQASFPLALYMLGACRRHAGKRLFWLCVTVGLLVPIPLSESRSGLAVLALSLLLVLLFRRHIFPRAGTRLVITGVAVTACLAVAPLLLTTRAGGVFDLVLEMLTTSNLHSLVDRIGHARFEIYQYGLQLVQEHWLWGIGFGDARFRISAVIGRDFTQHNFIIKLWAGAGIFAVVFFLAFIGLVIKQGLSILRKKVCPGSASTGLIAALLISLVGQLILGLANPMLPWPYVWFTAAVLAALCVTDKAARRTSAVTANNQSQLSVPMGESWATK